MNFIAIGTIADVDHASFLQRQLSKGRPVVVRMESAYSVDPPGNGPAHRFRPPGAHSVGLR